MKRAIEILFTTSFICGFVSLQLCSGEQERAAYAEGLDRTFFTTSLRATPLRRGRLRRQEGTGSETIIQPTTTVFVGTNTVAASVMQPTPSFVMTTTVAPSVSPSGGPPKSDDHFKVEVAVVMALVFMFVAVVVIIAVIAAIAALMRMRVRKIRKKLLGAAANVQTQVHAAARRDQDRSSRLSDPDAEKGTRNLTAQLALDLEASFRQRGSDGEVDFSKLQLQEKLGSGAYGAVYKATAADIDPDTSKPSVIAVKVLKDGAREAERQALLAEIALMKKLDPAHPHLVGMLGYCTAGEHVAMVTEFMPHGNLRDFLVKHRKLTEDICSHTSQTDSEGKITELGQNGTRTSKFKQMTTFKLLSLARQIAMGMEYLSSKNIVHGGLAARNVLIDREGKLRISAFGFSGDLFEALYCKSSGGKLLLRWMAFEAIVHRSFTVQSDVWSFGVVLWEIFTLGLLPYPKLSDSEILQKLREGYRMAQPRNCPDELYQLMCDCWKEQASERPSFGMIVECLNRIIAQDEEAREHLDTIVAGFHSAGNSERCSGWSSGWSSRRSSGRSSGESSNCGIEEQAIVS